MRVPYLIGRFAALDHAKRRVVLTAIVCMPLFWLGLRLLGLSRFHAMLQRPRETAQPQMTLPEVKAMATLVAIAARHSLAPVTCLTRSLLLVWLLRRNGVESQLRIGVRLTRGVLRAHAWVQCQGEPVNDEADISSRFASFGDIVPLRAFDTT